MPLRLRAVSLVSPKVTYLETLDLPLPLPFPPGMRQIIIQRRLLYSARRTAHSTEQYWRRTSNMTTLVQPMSNRRIHARNPGTARTSNQISKCALSQARPMFSSPLLSSSSASPLRLRPVLKKVYTQAKPSRALCTTARHCTSVSAPELVRRQGYLCRWRGGLHLCAAGAHCPEGPRVLRNVAQRREINEAPMRWAPMAILARKGKSKIAARARLV